jgi:hypothetical protein
VVREVGGPTMPTIACPGCGKKYKLPESAAGQVAKCACGKKFKVGTSSGTVSTAASAKAPSPKAAATSGKPTTATAKPASAPKPAAPAKAKVAATSSSRPVAPAAAAIDDGFWDEGLKEPVHSAPPPQPAAKRQSSSDTVVAGNTKTVVVAAPKKKKKRKSGGVKWGFDWGKVIGGTVTFLVAGGITYMMFMASGRIFIWTTIAAIGGLFTAINGLMGEEGIW